MRYKWTLTPRKTGDYLYDLRVHCVDTNETAGQDLISHPRLANWKANRIAKRYEKRLKLQSQTGETSLPTSVWDYREPNDTWDEP